MGAARRPQPKHLAGKLLEIRVALGLTQEEMAERLKKTPSPPQPAHISRFEQRSREPSLPVLLAYARLAGVSMDVLVDDTLHLPAKLPAKSARTKKA
jgi:transcriptional regulator with XRE-family HTH domain